MGEVLRLLGVMLFITAVYVLLSHGQILVQASLDEYMHTSYGRLQKLEIEGVSEEAGQVLSQYEQLSR